MFVWEKLIWVRFGGFNPTLSHLCLRRRKMILTKFLKILSPSCWYFDELWTFLVFSDQLGLEWRDCRNQRVNKQDVWQGNRQKRKSTRNYQVFILIKKVVSVLVSVRCSIVSLTGCTQKVPLFELDNPTRYYDDFYSRDSWNFCFTHSWRPPGSDLTMDIPLTLL